jgi:hypothetical protein
MRERIMKWTYIIVGTVCLLVGAAVGGAGAAYYERQEAAKYAEWLHVEMAIACRTHPRIQAGEHSICNIRDVMQQMEFMALRTGKPTVRWEDIQAAEEAAKNSALAELQAEIDARNAEREAFIAECMAETIRKRDEMLEDPEMANFAQMFQSVGNQDVNNCSRQYDIQQQDRRLREKYGSAGSESDS